MSIVSRNIVHKKVVPGEDIDETMQRCLILYEDKLLTGLETGDIKGAYQRALETEEFIARYSENFLPERFRGKGYSRLRAVFAFPFEFPDDWYYPDLVPESRCFADGETAVMKLGVDEVSTLVLPMHEIDPFYGKHGGLVPSPDNPLSMKHVKRYWKSAVSLEEFTRDFVRQSERSYVWDSNYDRIEKPEVIIPEWSLGNISFLNGS